MNGKKRAYLNFTTPSGVDLAALSSSGFSGLLIHDCGFLPQTKNWHHPGVDSPFWRFYHNPIAGNHIHHAGRDIPLSPETALLIPADTVFDCCGPAAVPHFWLHFTLTRHSRVSLTGPVELRLDATLRALLTRIIGIHQQDVSPLWKQRLYHLSTSLLHTAFSLLDVPLSPPLPEPLMELLALIERAPHGDLSNAVLAARAGMSLEKFIRWFRQHMSETPASYVIQVRLKTDTELLALTDKTIDQVALECGLPNRHYFSRMFARRMGCGPAEFRKRQGTRKGV